MLVATRHLTLGGAPHIDIPIRLFSPEKGEPGGWFCRYEIGWPHEPYMSEGWGVDAMQAVTLTLQKIGVDLYFSEYHKSGKLMWEAPGRGYGFPVPHNARDLLIGDDAVYGA
jgi:hypothetical protein